MENQLTGPELVPMFRRSMRDAVSIVEAACVMLSADF